MTSAKAYTLLFLRCALGLLMLVWGADKLANPSHGMAVADRFYFGLFGARTLMPVLGIAQLALGLLVILGIARRYVYLALAAVTGLTLVGVWRSVLDPWGWYLGQTNALFFPSLIIFAGVLILVAFRDVDSFVLARKRSDSLGTADAGRTNAPAPSHNPAEA